MLCSFCQGAYCQRMKRKKSKLEMAAERAAEIIQAHLALPAADARAMKRDIRNLAVKSALSVKRGKGSRSQRNGDPYLRKICISSNSLLHAKIHFNCLRRAFLSA